MVNSERKNLVSLTENHQKEATKSTLCKDAYEICESGILTASLGALFLGSSSIFGIGAYLIFDNFFTRGPRLTEEAIPLTLMLGISAAASGFGTKLMYYSTERKCLLLAKHYEEYRKSAKSI